MATIFISHSSANNAHALAIADWLRDSGWDEYFLDISPARGLAPGERWQESLKHAADRCEAVLFLLSTAWRDSRWCLAEFLLAKQLGKKVFGVIVEAIPLDSLPTEMTAEWQLCDLVEGAERRTFRVSSEPLVQNTEVSFAVAGLNRLKVGLQKAGLDPSTFPWPPPQDPERAPYRGLKALDVEDAAIFFGREAAVVRGLDALRGLRERGVERMLVVLGASGAGKSSFLRAGLWPRLARDDRHFLPLPVIRPARAVISGPTGLIASLETAVRRRGRALARAEIRSRLESANGFERLLDDLRPASPGNHEVFAPTVVIPVDQAEELFNAEGQDETHAFLELLRHTLAPRGENEDAGSAARQRAIAVLAIRSDSYEKLQTEPHLAQVKTSLFDLRPMATAECKAVIEGPAARATASGRKLTIDPALTERLLADTEGVDALPLLAFSLEWLFVEHGGDRDLRLDEYVALGGSRGAIEAAIQASFAEPERPPVIPAKGAERDRLLRAAFVPWLARIDPETEERQRRVARWDEIPTPSRSLVERLIDHRLLIRDRRAVDDLGDDAVVVEVAHEALLRQWNALTTWLDEAAERLKQAEVVKRAASEWDRNHRHEAWLTHTGPRLDAARALYQESDFAQLLGTIGHEYLAACLARDEHAQAEREAQRQRELEAARTLAAESEMRRKAEAQRAEEAEARVVDRDRAAVHLKAALREAVAGKLVMQSRAILEGQRSGPTELALLMGAAGYRLKPDNDAYGGLQYAINATQGISKIVPFPERVIAISPDRMTVVSEKERTLRLWDVPTAQPRGVPLSGHTHNIMSAAFSPDGKTLVTVSADTTVRLWDTLTGQPRGAPLEGHGRWVDHVAFSPEGKTFVSSSQDALRLWDAATGTLRGGLDRSDAGWVDVRSLAFSRDGKTLVSGNGDFLTEDVNSLRLWDAATGDPRSGAMKGHTAPVSSVAFSPSGKIVASGSADNTVRLWDAASGKPRGEPLKGHTNRVQIVAFSPDGNTLASGSDDGTLRLWDGVTGQPRGAPLTGHTNWVTYLAFSPDGETIVSSDNNSVRLWDVVTGQPRGAPLEGYMLREGAAFSPDSNTVFYGDGNTLRIADVGQRRGVPLQGHTSVVWTVAFSPDGKTVVSGSHDKTLRLWDVATGQPHGMPLLGHTDAVETVAFSPDGKTLISRGGDKTVRLWDVAAGLPRGEPLEGYESFVGSVVWSPDGQTLVSRGEGNTARLWDVATRRPRGVPLQGHTSTVKSVAFSNDSKTLVSGSYDHTLRVWDTATGLALGAPMQGQSNGEMVAFSPDGKTIVASDLSTLQLWDLATRQPRGGALTGNMESNPGGVFSADGATLVSIDGNTLRLWDVTNGQPRGAPLQGHANRVTSVAFSPDGKTLVSASDDWALRLWDVATAQPRGAPLEGHTDKVTSVAFSPDGNTIVSGSHDKTLRVWDSPDVWIDRICAKLVRNMSHAEWKRYVGDVPYETQCPALPTPED